MCCGSKGNGPIELDAQQEKRQINRNQYGSTNEVGSKDASAPERRQDSESREDTSQPIRLRRKGIYHAIQKEE
jgi:hypothetical protein